MSITIADATSDLIYHVSKNMRDRDFEEISAVCWENNREDLAQGLALRYSNVPGTLCIGRDGVPIAIYSAVALRPGVWSYGLWATPDMPKIGKFISEFLPTVGFSALRSAGAHRVECHSIVGYTEIHDWLRFVGFAQGETVKKMGKNGEDFIHFYWIEGMPWPRGYDHTAEIPRSRLDQKN